VAFGNFFAIIVGTSADDVFTDEIRHEERGPEGGNLQCVASLVAQYSIKGPVRCANTVCMSQTGKNAIPLAPAPRRMSA